MAVRRSDRGDENHFEVWPSSGGVCVCTEGHRHRATATGDNKTNKVQNRVKRHGVESHHRTAHHGPTTGNHHAHDSRVGKKSSIGKQKIINTRHGIKYRHTHTKRLEGTALTSLISSTSPLAGEYTSLAAFTDSTDPNESLSYINIKIETARDTCDYVLEKAPETTTRADAVARGNIKVPEILQKEAHFQSGRLMQQCSKKINKKTGVTNQLWPPEISCEHLARVLWIPHPERFTLTQDRAPPLFILKCVISRNGTASAIRPRKERANEMMRNHTTSGVEHHRLLFHNNTTALKKTKSYPASSSSPTSGRSTKTTSPRALAAKAVMPTFAVSPSCIQNTQPRGRGEGGGGGEHQSREGHTDGKGTHEERSDQRVQLKIQRAIFFAQVVRYVFRPTLTMREHRQASAVCRAALVALDKHFITIPPPVSAGDVGQDRPMDTHPHACPERLVR